MNLIEEYREQHELDYSHDTLVNYLSDMKQFLEYASNSLNLVDHVEIVKSLDWSICNKYRNYLKKSNKKETSINRKLSSINSLLDMCIKLRLIQENPLEDVKRLSTKHIVQKNDFLTEDEFELLCQAIETPEKGDRNVDFIKARDLLMYTMIVTGGMRISETISITLDDMDFEKHIIYVLGKGDKFRKVPFDDYVIELFNNYMVEREKMINKGIVDVDNLNLLFLSHRGKKLTTKASNKRLKKYCERANIKDISNHVLRHTFATMQVNRGSHINTIADILGHTSVKTTSRYMHTSHETMHKNIGIIRKK